MSGRLRFVSFLLVIGFHSYVPEVKKKKKKKNNFSDQDSVRDPQKASPVYAKSEPARYDMEFKLVGKYFKTVIYIREFSTPPLFTVSHYLWN